MDSPDDHNMIDDFSDDESAVQVPIEGFIDLHLFAPKDIPAVVEEYLFQCHERGWREVRIIHGRGTGTQRAIVHALLKTNSLVAEFQDAPPHFGGWGATMVRLKT
jgi:DNA-nicking Smr family endonuclease